MKLLLVILLSITPISIANQIILSSPDKKLEIKKICNLKTDKCSFYLGRKVIIQNISEEKITYKWIGNIFVLNINLGSYNSYLILIDEIHNPYILPNVVALDKNTKCIMSINDKGIYFYNFFQEKPLKVILKNSKQFNFAKNVVSLQAIIQARFEKKHLIINYLNNHDESVNTIINNPCLK